MVARFWKGFYWGPPSHRPIAVVGFVAGLLVLALPLVIALFGTGGHPLFLLALVFVGLAEAGWGVELLPRTMTTTAGAARAARWVAAVFGLVLSVISVVGQLAPLWFAGVVAAGALALVFEMAPGGFANRA
jgi:hypothetical protein